MATITSHRDQDVVEHGLGSVVPVLVSLGVLLGMIAGIGWLASQAVDLLGWAVAGS